MLRRLVGSLTTAYPPNYAIWRTGPAGGSLNSTLYPSNFYNGTGIGDFRQWCPLALTQSYLPTTSNNGAIRAAVQPINLY